MLERLKALFEGKHELAVNAKGVAADEELKVATVVLLLEAAYGDQEFIRKEQRLILRGIEREFGLDSEEAHTLAARAESIRPPAVTLKDLTDVVRAGFDVEQRTRVLTWIWKILEADRSESDWEQSFVDYVTERLGLTPEQARVAQQRAHHREV
jgi:uncharacterized tellurite resistance protein B-like protein